MKHVCPDGLQERSSLTAVSMDEVGPRLGAAALHRVATRRKEVVSPGGNVQDA